MRYAKAFFSSASEKGLIEIVKNDIDLLLFLIQSQPRFRELLASPIVKAKEKSFILDKMFKDQLHAITMNFLQLLLKNNREIYLLEMCLNFQGLYGKSTGIKSAKLVTAVAMDDTQIQNINQLIADRFGVRAEVSAKVDERLIGGFILKVEDQQLDASVSTQLIKMRRELVNYIKN